MNFKTLSLIFIIWSVVSTTHANTPISETEAAAFALLVYHDADQPPLPPGFSLLCQAPTSFQNKHYYGEAYYRLEPEGVTIVIAHRGTALSLANLADDFLIAFKKAPESFVRSSKEFTDFVSGLAYLKFPYSKGYYQHQFIHVGHSLGAIHAELNYVYQYARDEEVYAYSFESPGSKEIMIKLILSGHLSYSSLAAAESIEIINADINAINSLNEQVSTVKRISPDFNFRSLAGFSWSPIDLKYFSSLFTLGQHSMAAIYQYFQRGGKLLHSERYPVGLVAAFRYYKTYYPSFNEDHRVYWDKAFHRYWEEHAEIHAQYSHNESVYREYMIKHHLL